MDDMNDLRSCQFRPLDAVNHLGLWMTLMTPGHELSTLDTMNASGLWLTWTTLCRKLKALDAMKKSRCRWDELLRVVSSRPGCYEQLRTMDDMRYSGSWAEGFGCYEQLKVMNDMNDSGSYEHRSLDDMNRSILWLRRTTPGRELKDPDAMNRLELWMIWMTRDPMSSGL